MNHRLLIAAASVAIAFSSTAYAQECEDGCGPPPCGEGQECPTPSPPPSLPNVPTGDGTPYASFFTLPGGNVVDGGTAYNTGIARVFTFGGGQGVPFTDQQFYFGGSDSNVTFQTDHINASVTGTAHQDDVHGRSDVSTALGYVVTLTAATSSIADQIATILAHSPLASAQGAYTLMASGTAARSSISTYSMFGPSGNAANAYGFYAACDTDTKIGGCVSSSWGMKLGFVRGTEFSDGDANTFYAAFSFGGAAEAGQAGLGHAGGDASVFVDPNILFNQQLSQFGNQIGYNIGNGGLGNGGFTALTGNVPEPASWALMLGGFGLLGGTMRRRRTLATA